MEYQILMPIIVFLALLAGDALGQYRRARWLRRNQARLRQEARHIIRDAERTGQSTLVEAELKAREMLLDERRHFEKEMEDLRQGLLERERIINKRLESLCQREGEIEARAGAIDKRQEETSLREENLRDRETSLESEFARIAGLDPAAARDEVLARAKAQAEKAAAQEAARVYSQKLKTAEEEGRLLIMQSLEAQAAILTAEHSVVLVPLEGDEMKSRIIGREGRNIRAFESICSVEVLLDEVPGQAMICSASSERREIARRCLMVLMKDGRIQPSRIEEFYAKISKEVAAEGAAAGHDAALRAEAGILPEPLAYALGQLRFRSSFGQNVLQHLVETALAAGVLAEGLGLSAEEQMLARRAALLHDIGKGLPAEAGRSHALRGADFLKECEESGEVINAAASHHRETAQSGIISALVRVADTLSAARPGARRQDYAAYLQRLQSLEQTAMGFSGVQRAYAIQAGRELHVIVSGNQVSDQDLPLLAAEIAANIEKQVSSGLEVRVTLYRETRAVSQASWRPPSE